MTTSWDEEGGGPDVAGSGINAIGLERLKPLINQQVAMKNREQITESLFTGGCRVAHGEGWGECVGDRHNTQREGSRGG